MKKIGLITFHASHNIGSMLQTYAMQHVLESIYDKNVEVINFSTKRQKEIYSLFFKWDSIKKAIMNIAVLLFYKQFKSRFNDFEKFLGEYINTTERKYETVDELAEIENEYDVLVCGSDQIWNTNCADFDNAYFLSFAKDTPKIAYAPSLGGKNILSNIKKNPKVYTQYLEGFHRLSVREENGKKWLKELTDKKIEVLPDPTLLLDKSNWEALAKQREFEEKYIFFYGAVYHPDTYEVLEKISKKLNMKIVMLDYKRWFFKKNLLRGFSISKHCSPADYLGLIKNAEMVITTSFHGTIFSTVFNKNFWTLTFKSTNEDDDRIQTLLNQLDMSSRRIYMEDIGNIDLSEDVNYDNYVDSIENLRERGFSYLNEAFNSLKCSN